MTTRREVRRGPAMANDGAGTRERVVRAVVVLGLAVDAYIHLRMAPVMDIAAPGGVGGGTLFRAQGTAAAVAGLVLLVRPRWWTYGLATLVALSALGPSFLYHYVAVPAIGPIPSMYDPLWSAEKVVSMIGEALAAGFGLWGMVLTAPRRRQQEPRVLSHH